jgi:hypothetical protein
MQVTLLLGVLVGTYWGSAFSLARLPAQSLRTKTTTAMDSNLTIVDVMKAQHDLVFEFACKRTPMRSDASENPTTPVGPRGSFNYRLSQCSRMDQSHRQEMGKTTKVSRSMS